MQERYLLLSREYASFSVLKKYKTIEKVLIDIERLIDIDKKDEFLLVDTQLKTYSIIKDFYNRIGSEVQI